MTMDVTPRWALPQLFAGQAQKEIFHNEALARIDMLLHGEAMSADETVPPSTPDAGMCWIVADGASGVWEGKEGAVACWTEGGWRFIPPKTGLTLWVADRGHAMRYGGSYWKNEIFRSDGIYLDDLRVVGARKPGIADPSGGATVDGEARTTLIAVLETLRDHGLIEH